MRFLVEVTIAWLISVGACFAAEAQSPATRPATTTSPGASQLVFSGKYDPADDQLTIELSNRGPSSVKVDGDLVFGMDVTAQAADGSELTWDNVRQPPEAAPRSPRIIDLAPGQSIRRVMSLREGFDYFYAARGAFRLGETFVERTTASYARHRLLPVAPQPARIIVRLDCRDGMLRDGFASLTGKRPEAMGLELGPIGPAIVPVEAKTADAPPRK